MHGRSVCPRAMLNDSQRDGCKSARSVRKSPSGIRRLNFLLLGNGKDPQELSSDPKHSSTSASDILGGKFISIGIPLPLEDIHITVASRRII